MNPLVGPSERAVRHSTSAIGASFALSVADIDASVKWYSEKLEMKVTMREPNTNGAAVAVLEGDGLIVELIQHDSARPLTTAAPAAKEPSTSTASSRWGSSSAISRKTLANVIVRDNAGNLIQFFGNESKE